jgi:hypothetical protein
VTLEWWNYDLWGNARDGYNVNDRSASGDTVVIYENDTDKTILARMREAGIVGKGVKTSGIEIDGELPWSLYFNSARGKPLGELSESPVYRKGVPNKDASGWDRVSLPMVRNTAKKTSRRKNPSDDYEVIVGNVGTVYRGDKLGLAIKAFTEYVKKSKSDVGRASGESVVLMVDGEPMREHYGDND